MGEVQTTQPSTDPAEPEKKRRIPCDYPGTLAYNQLSDVANYARL